MIFPLSRFLNQTVTYQEFTGSNDRDDPTYGLAQSVPARYVEIDRERYSKEEEQHFARSRVWLAFQPVLKSLIDGREIVSVSAMVQVSGDGPGWTAELR